MTSSPAPTVPEAFPPPKLKLPDLGGFQVGLKIEVINDAWEPILAPAIEELILTSDHVVDFDDEYSLCITANPKLPSCYNLKALHFEGGVYDDAQSMTINHFKADEIEEIIELATNNALVICTSSAILLELDHDGLKLSKFVNPHPGYAPPSMPALIGRFVSHCQKQKKTTFGPKNPFSRAALRNIRQETDSCDFSIFCEEEDKSASPIPIRVHSLVLKSVWPFFRSMLESGMSESDAMTMTMPYPRSWVESLIKFFYDEHNELSFDDATGLLVIAKTYDVPTITISATQRIKDEGDLDLTKALLAWRRSYEAGNDAIRTHCAVFIGLHYKELSEAFELLPDYSKDELLCLLSDLALSL